MLYVNKLTGNLVHLLEWVDSNDALVTDLLSETTKTIPYRDFKSQYIQVNIDATRKHICGCYTSKVK